MAVDAQDPGNIGRDFALEVEHRGGERVERLAPGGADVGLADIEQHRGFEDEAVADDMDVGARAEDLAQAAEEVGAVAREFLHLLRQRDIEARAEIGDLRLRLLAGGFGGGERVLDRGELAAQRGDLLVEHVDLGERARGNVLLRVQRRTGRRHLVVDAVGRRGAFSGRVLQALPLLFGGVERRGQGRDLDLVVARLSCAPSPAGWSVPRPAD